MPDAWLARLELTTQFLAAGARVLSPIFFCPSSGRQTRVRETALRGGQRKIGATRREGCETRNCRTSASRPLNHRSATALVRRNTPGLPGARPRGSVYTTASLRNNPVGAAVLPVILHGSRLALTPGARLGPYEILSALGAGGMGRCIVRATRSSNREVAIKILPESFAQRSRAARPFRARSEDARRTEPSEHRRHPRP